LSANWSIASSSIEKAERSSPNEPFSDPKLVSEEEPLKDAFIFVTRSAPRHAQQHLKHHTELSFMHQLLHVARIVPDHQQLKLAMFQPARRKHCWKRIALARQPLNVIDDLIVTRPP
jgi:hypothetical protein